MLTLPLNVNAQIPILPNTGNLAHLPTVQPSTNLTAQAINKTSTAVNMTALGQELLYTSTGNQAVRKMNNDLNNRFYHHIPMTVQDLITQKAICTYYNVSNTFDPLANCNINVYNETGQAQNGTLFADANHLARVESSMCLYDKVFAQLPAYQKITGTP